MLLQILSYVISVLGIGLLMIVHESGHFFAARAMGMRVLKFSIGAGPVLFRKQSTESGTVFQVALVPFLAYVQIAGMNPLEENDPADTGLFDRKSVPARAFVIAAGPIANYLFAVVMIFGLAIGGHAFYETVPGRVQVNEVFAGSAAREGGLRADDVVLAVEGRAVHEVQEMIDFTSARPDQPTHYRIERGGSVQEIVLTPRRAGSVGRIGAGLGSERKRIASSSFADAARLSVAAPFTMTVEQLKAIGRAIRQKTTREFGGIVAMGSASVQAVEQGPASYLLFLVMISIALGFFNLLPFPALDGGRLVFLAIEVIFRRRINQNIEMSVNAIGMATLLTLMVVITFQDISRLW